jgi:dTDP-4-dehydrorhamnose 3,5-epimerase
LSPVPDQEWAAWQDQLTVTGKALVNVYQATVAVDLLSVRAGLTDLFQPADMPYRRARIPAPRLGPGKQRGAIVEVVHVPQVSGVLLFRPQPHVDERGFFSRTFDAEVARAAGIDPAGFAQDSLSRSALGVIRGMHIRRGDGEAKLVRCSYGAIFDVVVDLRPASPTYRRWASFELRDDEQISLYVPAGCAHGFQALTNPADVSYRIDRAHEPGEDVAIAFDDPELAIPWPLPVKLMSQRDMNAPKLAAVTDTLAQATWAR